MPTDRTDGSYYDTFYEVFRFGHWRTRKVFLRERAAMLAAAEDSDLRRFNAAWDRVWRAGVYLAVSPMGEQFLRDESNSSFADGDDTLGGWYRDMANRGALWRSIREAKRSGTPLPPTD